MRIEIVGPAYRSQSASLDAQNCINAYFEPDETGLGKAPGALFPTPGLKSLGVLPGGQGRGLITSGGRTIAVVGSQVWALSGTPELIHQNKIHVGDVITDGQPVSMCAGPNQFLIASAGNLYSLKYLPLSSGGGQSFTHIALASDHVNANTGNGLLGAVSQVAYSDSFFIALQTIHGFPSVIQSSTSFDGTTWPQISETGVSVFPDDPNAIFVNARRLWVFGPKGIQPYFNAGDVPFPFDPDDSGYIEQGLAAPFSPAKIDNSFFWLGADERGFGVVWRANGYTPRRISNFALEYEMSTYPTIADAVCHAYQERGHAFYVMNFPAANKTWVYDCATQSWHQRGYWNGKIGSYDRSRAGFHVQRNSRHLVLDPIDGTLYEQRCPFQDNTGTWQFADDAGNIIRRQRTSPHMCNEQKRIFGAKIQIDIEPGLGPAYDTGKQAPTTFNLLDANGALRRFGIGDDGIFTAPLYPIGDPLTATHLFMNDQLGTTSWEITIDAFGHIKPVLQTTFHDEYPLAIKFVSLQADQYWTMQLRNLSAGVAQLKAIPIGPVGRGPEMTLEKSRDGGHSYVNLGTRDCGRPGEHSKRLIWNRVGTGRDWVIRLTWDGPAPIIDAYFVTPDEAQKSA